MAFVNQNYCNLKESYLFSQIAQVFGGASRKENY